MLRPCTIGVGVAMGFMDEAMVIMELFGLGGCMGMREFMGPIEEAGRIALWVDMGRIECGIDMDMDIDMCMFMDIEGAMDGVAEGVMYASIA